MELNSSIAAVITGGASGLGEATARALAAKGVKVALLDMNKTKGEAVAAELGGADRCRAVEPEGVVGKVEITGAPGNRAAMLHGAQELGIA